MDTTQGYCQNPLCEHQQEEEVEQDLIEGLCADCAELAPCSKCPNMSDPSEMFGADCQECCR